MIFIIVLHTITYFDFLDFGFLYILAS